jgi:cytochrome c-type biogenesis protein CcmE
MTRKRRRLYFVLLSLLALGAAAALVLAAFEENIVFFYSPTDALAKDLPPDRRFRVGGLVEEGSLTRRDDGVTVAFRVTDLETSILVTYRGILPDLFREGQGVVAEGHLAADGTFRASDVLAKHDETYMPPEVAEALKESGVWRGAKGPGASGGEAMP